MPEGPQLDALVVAAHPDDAEIAIGGTILRLVRAGARVGVVDCTRGEMGTRGDEAARTREADAATQALGLTLRANLDLPDGRVEVTLDARERLAALLRRTRPSVVIAHLPEDLHPDHCAAGQLAREAWYLAGLKRLAQLAGDDQAHRPASLYHFLGHVRVAPTLVVDIEPVWEDKLNVVRCFASQLEPDSAEDTGEHFLFGSDILGRMTTSARYFGELISARVGEPLVHAGPLRVDDPLLGMLSR